VSARPGRVGGFAYPLGLFVLIGVALWGWSAWRLVRGRPTPAVVVSSAVGESRGRNGTAYAPRVAYRYDVEDSTYVGTRTLPGSGEGRSRAWAEAIARRYAPGDSTIAWVDPSDAGSAFLVRQPSAAVLMVIVAPLALLGVLAVERGGGSADDPLPPPDPASAGPGSWAVALRDDPVRDAASLSRAAGRWRLAALAVAAAHLGLVLGCAAGEGGVARGLAAAWRATLGDGFFVFDAAALAGAAWYVRRRGRAALATASRVRMARVLLDRAPLTAGSAVDATLHLAAGGAGSGMRDTTLRLERETRDAAGKSRQRDLLAPLGAEGGRAPDAAHPQTFVIPDAAPPSTVRAGEPTRTTWAFVADLRFADGHQATLRFPVRVHARA
jgi:hypothetical protein